jgi:ubiquinone biosynthesis protein
MHPKYVADKVWSQFNEYEEILEELPETVKDFTSVMKKGKMRIEITTPELEIFLKKINKISNRLSFSIVLLSLSIILVGLIIGTTITGHPSILLTKFPAVEIGFGIAAVVVLWLLYSIIKTGRF